MANKILVNTGKMWLGSLAMAGGHPSLDGNVKIHLFKNNVTLSRTTVIGSLTESTYTGYAAQTLNGATDGGIDVNNWDTWSWPVKTFQQTGASASETAFGYYVTDSAGTTLLWGENFTTPQVFTNSGDGFTITPTFSFGSLFLN